MVREVKKKTTKRKVTKKTTGKRIVNSGSRKKTAKVRKKAASKKSKSFSWFWFLFKSAFFVGILCAIALGIYMWHLDKTVQQQFAGEKWQLPTHVYSRPTELYPGINIDQNQLIEQLTQLGYAKQSNISRSGNYQLQTSDNQTTVGVHIRELETPSISQKAKPVYIIFKNNRISQIVDSSKQIVQKIFLEPQIIGTIGENKEEDRKLIRIEDVPPAFIKTLLVTEDKDFFNHFGISPKGIARAMISNIKQGRLAQGGSTITQQLVKNFYLSNERKLKRKINEALISILLEIHYSKEEILEAYINEIYLGQAGNRAVHGFNLASFFYFNRPLNELTLDQFATLVGMIKGPSIYNPVRKPDNAIKRRNIVIGLLKQDNVIDQQQYDSLIKQPLKVAQESNVRQNIAYPAYMDYVLDDLSTNIQPQDGSSSITSHLQGMDVFSSMDIYTQKAAEQALTKTLVTIEKDKGLEQGSLQGAIIVTKVDTGEVIAMTSDRDARFSGYNRALDAKRQVGSLLKPAIFLSAIEYNNYTLASIINDAPIRITLQDNQVWEPDNYDRKFVGNILLVDALAKSRNVPTVRIGMDVGLDKLIDTLHRLGLSSEIPKYPSILLGSSTHTPYEVSQMYQTIANGGHRINLYGAQYINDKQHKLKWQNNRVTSKVVSDSSSFLIDTALQSVVNNGTAGSLRSTFKKSQIIAGKTGTTNDYRDSWFAGYSGNTLAVVWVGRDDNKITKLTGSSGALKVWQSLFETIGTSSWPVAEPARISYLDVNKSTGAMTQASCSNTINLPFVIGTEPSFEPCQRSHAQNRVQEQIQDEIRAQAVVENRQVNPQRQQANEEEVAETNWFQSLFGGGNDDQRKVNVQKER